MKMWFVTDHQSTIQQLVIAYISSYEKKDARKRNFWVASCFINNNRNA